MKNRNVVVIEGCRTPFMKSGTAFMSQMSYQLGQYAIKGLLDKTAIDPVLVDEVVYGNVISNIRTGNVAREAAITAGLLSKTPCHTVTQACISANRAIASGVASILLGQADVVIAGGVDCVSDTPIGYKKKMQQKLFKAQKIKGFGDTLKFIFSLRPGDFAPDRPKVAEFLTKRTMGEDCEILASKYNISREAQDAFAARSHQLAAKAFQDGHLGKEVVQVSIPPKFKSYDTDNGVRGDSTAEKIAKLRPAFSKHGTLTAANSSFLTDGASAILLMSEEKALELGLKPKAYIRDFTFSGQDLKEELLLGPTYAISKLLKQTDMTLQDMDVIELHEAFAGQVLANLHCIASDDFAKKNLDRDKAIGEIPMEKLNTWGGSLSIGHPFGATGARLVTTAANRLIHENKKYALIAACAAGAHGHAMLLERYNA